MAILYLREGPIWPKVGEGSANMAKPPPYGQKRDGHPKTYGVPTWPKERGGPLFGHPPTGRVPIWPKGRLGSAYMAKEG